MTRKQIYNQIAAFTGDWKEASKQAKIFDENSQLPLRSIAQLRLAWGRFLRNGKYEGDNREVLRFIYHDKRGMNYHFSIVSDNHPCVMGMSLLH